MGKNLSGYERGLALAESMRGEVPEEFRPRLLEIAIKKKLIDPKEKKYVRVSLLKAVRLVKTFGNSALKVIEEEETEKWFDKINEAFVRDAVSLKKLYYARHNEPPAKIQFWFDLNPKTESAFEHSSARRIKQLLATAGQTVPTGLVFVSDHHPLPLYSQIQGMQNGSIILMPHPTHLDEAKPWFEPTHSIPGAIAKLCFSIDREKKRLIVTEMQFEAIKRDKDHPTGITAKVKNKYYRNWHASLFLAALEYARARGLTVYSLPSEYQLKSWPQLSTQRASEIYDEKPREAAELAGIKPRQVPFGKVLQHDKLPKAVKQRITEEEARKLQLWHFSRARR